MNIRVMKQSIMQIRGNIEKLKKKESLSEKEQRRLAKAEAKLECRLERLREREDSLGYKPKDWDKAEPDSAFDDHRSYIASPEWAFRKEEYYKLHKKVCRSCGSDDREIHLHHRTYKRIFREDDGDLMPLCRECHASLHHLQRSLKLSVEEASKVWVSATLSAKKKKRARKILRSCTFDEFEAAFKSSPAQTPKEMVEVALERVVRNKSKPRDHLIKNREKVMADIAYTHRTGDTRSYDQKVDELIKVLSKGFPLKV